MASPQLTRSFSVLDIPDVVSFQTLINGFEDPFLPRLRVAINLAGEQQKL